MYFFLSILSREFVFLYFISSLKLQGCSFWIWYENWKPWNHTIGFQWWNHDIHYPSCFHGVKNQMLRLTQGTSRLKVPLCHPWQRLLTCLDLLSAILDESSTASKIWYSLLLGLVLLSQILSFLKPLAIYGMTLRMLIRLPVRKSPLKYRLTWKGW